MRRRETRNDQPVARQFARGSAALVLADHLTGIEKAHEGEHRKALERFHAETHAINDRYLGQMKGAIRSFNNAIDQLESDVRTPEDEDDEL